MKYMLVKFSYYGHENQVELYDMENDPLQLENICRLSNEKMSEKCGNILSEFEPYLERMRVCSGKTCQQKNWIIFIIYLILKQKIKDLNFFFINLIIINKNKKINLYLKNKYNKFYFLLNINN